MVVGLLAVGLAVCLVYAGLFLFSFSGVVWDCFRLASVRVGCCFLEGLYLRKPTP